MKRVAVLLALPLVLAAQGSPEGAIFKLRWLQGEWIEKKGAKTTREKWTLDEDDALSGRSESGHWQEIMKITSRKGGHTWLTVTQPGKKPVPFRLVTTGPKSAVFTNPRHDYPQLIAYKRDEGGLHATISLINGKRAAHWHYRANLQ